MGVYRNSGGESDGNFPWTLRLFGLYGLYELTAGTFLLVPGLTGTAHAGTLVGDYNVISTGIHASTPLSISELGRIVLPTIKLQIAQSRGQPTRAEHLNAWCHAKKRDVLC